MVQDYVMTAFGVFFAVALMPQVTAGFKRRPGVTLFTSGVTALGLCVYTVCGVTLGLLFTPVVWGITATLWATILVQELLWCRRAAG